MLVQMRRKQATFLTRSVPINHLEFSKTFRSVHGTGFTSRLPPEAYIGPIDLSIIPTNKDILSQDEVYDAEIRAKLPPPYAVINLREIEVTSSPYREGNVILKKNTRTWQSLY